MTEDITYDVRGRVGVITLNRPQRRNAFTFDMIHRWPQLLEGAESDGDVAAVVLTGAGDSFCSGVDLALLEDTDHRPETYKAMLTQRIHKIAYAMDGMSKPVIAAIGGPAIGAGLDMALMCDLRFAARSATMAERYIRLGLVPGDGGAFYLPRIVGPAKALELLLTGDTIDAEEALRIGMVNRVYDDSDLVAETVAFAESLAGYPPVALGMIKRAVRHTMGGDLRAHMDLISSHFGIAAMGATFSSTIKANRSS
ncbi:MAG TPA: enoyl-CoA hydratase/isomerase family protein [Nocardioidaceae bacterium]|nr:enoyl-CoA hydratase/isomerase family protein [Nocardioidaceae bacterium]